MKFNVWNYKKKYIYKAKSLGNLGGAHRSTTEEVLFKKSLVPIISSQHMSSRSSKHKECWPEDVGALRSCQPRISPWNLIWKMNKHVQKCTSKCQCYIQPSSVMYLLWRLFYPKELILICGLFQHINKNMDN